MQQQLIDRFFVILRLAVKVMQVILLCRVAKDNGKWQSYWRKNCKN